jgi:hypothetical protein
VDAGFDRDCILGPMLPRLFLRTAIGLSSSTILAYRSSSAIAIIMAG